MAAALAGALGEDLRPGAIFYKMSGSGNDFILFDGRYSYLEDFTPARIKALCDRRQGAGADGVIMLDPGAAAGTHFYFHFWNSDGSPGPMCGNGALCATRLSTLLELAPADGEVCFATPAGIHQGSVREGRPEIRLPDCAPPKPLAKVALEPGERDAYLGTPSVPHLVILVDDVGKVELERRGPPLRNDPAIGAGGANVNWMSPKGDGSYLMRTYERGVEGETLACGTGAVACALVLSELGMAKPPVRLWTRSGLPLDINWQKSLKAVTHITLAGEGRLVFRGIVGEPQTSVK